MRPDLAKVICEDARRGPRDYMGGRKGYGAALRFRVAEDRGRDYSALECLPGHESMRARLGGNGRRFSENLGALRGIVIKAIGHPWDAIYGELCRLVSPSGSNIERHVHQHLRDFLITRTRMAESGVEYCDCSGGYWTSLTAERRWGWHRQPCYVHPLSGLVLRVPEPPRRETRIRRQCVLPADDPLSRYAQIKGIWYALRLEPASYRRISCASGDVWEPIVRDCAIAQLANEMHTAGARAVVAPKRLGARREQEVRIALYGGDLVAITKKGLNHRELRRQKLKNDMNDMRA